jgi:hypothetical protein
MPENGAESMRVWGGIWRGASLAACVMLGASAASTPPDDGLLFRLSFDRDLTADAAQGDPKPNIADRVKVLPGGHAGSYLQLADDGVVSWHAAGNIYAQRATLAFFWRARTPLGRGEFPIFRVGYGDHTSWDMTWLRIDWNGHGFDAMVTDASLARVRVSYVIPAAPKPEEWLHLALAWDETQGIRFYVNGTLAGKVEGAGVYDTALDQFGPHSRTIGPMQVQTAYQYMRGGDVDELSIYDHALGDASIAALAHGEAAANDPAPLRDLGDPRWRAEWWHRYGWDAAAPAYLTSATTRIRKVEFSDARDGRERMTGANDGIPETTWPGVYNRSRIPGRHDYFELPDWNVYVDGGKAVTFILPNEAWNHLEVQGTADGTFTYVPARGSEQRLATRAAGQERSAYDFTTLPGGTLRFDNRVQEDPLQEVAAYNVTPGGAPANEPALTYTIKPNADPAAFPTLDELNSFVRGRFVADERQTVVALPDGAPAPARPANASPSLPIVHVLIPADLRTQRAGLPESHYGFGWQNMAAGLDGIVIELPPLKTAPTHNGLLPLNIQVKDPIWPARNMMDVSVSVKPGEARTLFLDTRDRLLPPDTSLYLTIAAAGGGFSAASLDGTKIRLVFKPRAQALPEHIADRFTQMRDNFAFFVEEHTSSRLLARFERFYREITDLFRADPDNVIAKQYWAEIAPEAGWPLAAAPPPKGVPLWAARQVEDLKLVRQYIDWWIDHRQSSYGDFGGGISDDDDLTEQWPPLALMGDEPDKIRRSLAALADAVDKNHMITNGLGTIKTDQLHSYEEGINAFSEDAYLANGDPKVIERLMETARGYATIIGPVGAGHTHVLSSLFSGTDVVREGPWAWSKPYSYLILHPGILLAEYNGNPAIKTLVLALADSYLAHGRKNETGATVFPEDINSLSDADRGTLGPGSNGVVAPLQLMWTAYRWSGDVKYLAPIESVVGKGDHATLSLLNANALDVLGKRDSWGRDLVRAADAGKGADARDNGARPLDFARFVAWQMTGDRHYLEALYTSEVTTDINRMYLCTEGELWSDRVELFSDLLQRSRLGGMALRRNQIFPGHLVSWRFDGPPTAAENVAILIEDASPTHFRVVGYNLTTKPIRATMTGQNIVNGEWSATTGARASRISFGRDSDFPIVFPPHEIVEVSFGLDRESPPVSERPDIGVGPEDIRVGSNAVEVVVHSIGALPTPPGTVTLQSATGKAIASAPIPALTAPLDLKPRSAAVRLEIPGKMSLAHAQIVLSLSGNPAEITLRNNRVSLP